MHTSITTATTRRARLGAASVLLAALLAACGAPGGTQAPASPTPAAPSTVASASASPSALAVESPSAEATASPSPTPTPTPVPTVAACIASGLSARITGWNGGMGQRFADVQLTNTSQATCIVFAKSRPQLVDGHGAVLIDGTAPAASSGISFAPGSVLKTQVAVGNYCGPASVVAPVSVAFVLSGVSARVVATAVSPTDQDGIPPCNGNPGDPGTISMHDWAP